MSRRRLFVERTIEASSIPLGFAAFAFGPSSLIHCRISLLRPLFVAEPIHYMLYGIRQYTISQTMCPCTHFYVFSFFWHLGRFPPRLDPPIPLASSSSSSIHNRSPPVLSREGGRPLIPCFSPPPSGCQAPEPQQPTKRTQKATKGKKEAYNTVCYGPKRKGQSPDRAVPEREQGEGGGAKKSQGRRGREEVENFFSTDFSLAPERGGDWPFGFFSSKRYTLSRVRSRLASLET